MLPGEPQCPTIRCADATGRAASEIHIVHVGRVNGAVRRDERH